MPKSLLLLQEKGGGGKPAAEMAESSHSRVVPSFAVGVAAGVAASLVAWKLFGSGKLAGSLGSPLSAHQRLRENGGRSTQDVDEGTKAASSVPMSQVLEDEVLKEHMTRNIQFFGEAAQLDLANSFVVVVGLGVRQ